MALAALFQPRCMGLSIGIFAKRIDHEKQVCHFVTPLQNGQKPPPASGLWFSRIICDKSLVKYA
jgi:hypothetical protein